MTSLGIILMSVVTTAVLFAIAIPLGKAFYRAMCWVYNKLKKEYELRESL